jgi:phosphoserine phosphatase RsbU/P
MRLRTLVLVGVLALVTAVMVAVLWGMSSIIDRHARSQLTDELERSRQVFEDLQAYRRSLFAAEIRVVAEEPRLKAVAATPEVDHETVLGVAQELRRAVASDIFIITDGDGHLLADVANPEATGNDLTSLPVVIEALTRGEGNAIWTDREAAYQVQARRLSFGTTAVGVLVIGHRIDDRVAQTVRRQTGSAVVVLLDGERIAASPLDDGRPVEPEITGVLATLGARPHELSSGGELLLALSAPYPSYGGGRSLRYVVLRSLDRALAFRRRLLDVLYVVGGLALVATVVLAVLLARRVARPMNGLVAFTRRVGGGELDARAQPTGLLETDALARALNRMVAELERSRGELAQKERLEQEMEIAQRIQTSILPRSLEAPGLEVAAIMRPASEVGGDYYDFLPHRGGCWIGIGDVAGHGLTAGLVMMMVQSIVAALTRVRLDASPSDVVCALNEVLYENIRHRLANDEHVTFSLLRYFDDGRILHAGAHEDLVIWRAATRRTELIPTQGTWLGAIADVRRVTSDAEAALYPGDVLLLYTDGLTEAASASGELFGLERVCAELERLCDRPVGEIREGLLGAVDRWALAQTDDITLLVIRREAA